MLFRKFFLLYFLFFYSCTFTHVIEYKKTLNKELLNTNFREANYDFHFISKIEMEDEDIVLYFKECLHRYKFKYNRYYVKEHITRRIIDSNGNINYYFFWIPFFVEATDWTTYLFLIIPNLPLFIGDMVSLPFRLKNTTEEKEIEEENVLMHKSGVFQCNPLLRISIWNKMYSPKDCKIYIPSNDWKKEAIEDYLKISVTGYIKDKEQTTESYDIELKKKKNTNELVLYRSNYCSDIK